MNRIFYFLALLSCPAMGAAEQGPQEYFPPVASPSPTLAIIDSLSDDVITRERLDGIFDGTARQDIMAVRLSSIDNQSAASAARFNVQTARKSVQVPVPTLVMAVRGPEKSFELRKEEDEKVAQALDLMSKTAIGMAFCASAGAPKCESKSFADANIKIVLTQNLDTLGRTRKDGRKVTIELSDKAMLMSETQIAIILGHELSHVEDFKTYPSLVSVAKDSPDPYLGLTEAKAQINNIFLLKELESKGLATKPKTLDEQYERAGNKIALAAWESKLTGKPMGSGDSFLIGNKEFDAKLQTFYKICSENAQNAKSSFETIYRIGIEVGSQVILEKLLADHPDIPEVEVNELFLSYIGKGPFQKLFDFTGGCMERKEIAFLRQQYGKADKLGQLNYDPNKEPIYVKKINLGLGLWDACNSAPKIKPVTVLQIQAFGPSLYETYVSELDNSFADNACQKKLLNHIRLNVGFGGVTADWLNYVVSHNFTNPPTPQQPPAGGGNGHNGSGGTGQPYNPHPQFPPGTWPTAGQKN